MRQYLQLLGRRARVVNFDPANEAVAAAAAAGTATTTTAAEEKNINANDNDDDRNGGNSDAPVLPYDAVYDVCTDAICLSRVMEEKQLGPNGGLMYCMEYLVEHFEEVMETIEERVLNSYDENGNGNEDEESAYYLIFDFPGQVELYTHSTVVQDLVRLLGENLRLRLAAVQLVDALFCADASKFLSAALLATTTMLRLELPTVNVLSKVDLLSQYDCGDGELLPFELEYFADCRDLDRLVPFLDGSGGRRGATAATADEFDVVIEDDDAVVDDPEYRQARERRRQSESYRKFERLHKAIAELVEDYGLLSFLPLNISSAESVGRVLARVDKCNGYVFTRQKGSVNEDLFQCAIRSDYERAGREYYESLADVKERIVAPRSAEIHANNDGGRRPAS